MHYYWWGCRRNLTLIRVKSAAEVKLGFVILWNPEDVNILETWKRSIQPESTNKNCHSRCLELVCLYPLVGSNSERRGCLVGVLPAPAFRPHWCGSECGVYGQPALGYVVLWPNSSSLSREVVRIGSIFIFSTEWVVESQVLRTVWCNVSRKAAGRVFWNWSLLRLKGLIHWLWRARNWLKIQLDLPSNYTVHLTQCSISSGHLWESQHPPLPPPPDTVGTVYSTSIKWPVSKAQLLYTLSFYIKPVLLIQVSNIKKMWDYVSSVSNIVHPKSSQFCKRTCYGNVHCCVFVSGKCLAVFAISVTVRLLVTYVVVLGNNLTVKEKIFVAISWLPKATVQVRQVSSAQGKVRTLPSSLSLPPSVRLPAIPLACVAGGLSRGYSEQCARALCCTGGRWETEGQWQIYCAGEGDGGMAVHRIDWDRQLGRQISLSPSFHLSAIPSSRILSEVRPPQKFGWRVV